MFANVNQQTSVMKLTLGKPARGDKYFNRPKIRAEILEHLDGGANILLTAPRRVGKTTIIMDIFDNPPSDYLVVYINTEKYDTTQDFFRKLLNELTDSDILEKYNGFGSKILGTLKDAGKRVKGFNIGPIGLDINETKDLPIDYADEFTKLIDDIKLDGKKIIALIDKFPVTVENIYNKYKPNDENLAREKVKRFLQTNRDIRQHPQLGEKIQFVYTGSIGLMNVVGKINCSEDINDLVVVKIPALTFEESADFLQMILNHYSISINEKIVEYALEKTEWLMPFYIQSVAREVRDLHRESPQEITIAFIDKAFENLIDNVHIYLDHFRSRLNKVFKKEELQFCESLLDFIANEGKINRHQLPEFAAKFNIQNYSYLINTLKYDGYIDNSIDDDIYRFNSPIFKKWWLKHGNK